MGWHDPFGYFKHKLWQKKGLKPRIVLISFCVGGVPHIVEKILTRATTLLWTSPQLEVYTQSYGPPKLLDTQFKEFRDSNLGVLGQNDIWVLAPWPIIKNTIRGKVVVSSKFRLWWVLWVRVCPCFVRAPKMFQLCINQLVVWFVQIRLNNWFVCHSP